MDIRNIAYIAEMFCVQVIAGALGASPGLAQIGYMNVAEPLATKTEEFFQGFQGLLHQARIPLISSNFITGARTFTLITTTALFSAASQYSTKLLPLISLAPLLLFSSRGEPILFLVKFAVTCSTLINYYQRQDTTQFNMCFPFNETHHQDNCYLQNSGELFLKCDDIPN